MMRPQLPTLGQGCGLRADSKLRPDIGRWANFEGHMGCHVRRGLKPPRLALLANQSNHYIHCYTLTTESTLESNKL